MSRQSAGALATEGDWPELPPADEGRSSPGAATILDDAAVDKEQLVKRGYALRTLGHPGDGKTYPQDGDRVCVSFVGRLASGGATFEVAERFEFALGAGSVIAGLEKGVAEMSLGQQAHLAVHYSHAYGAKGAPSARAIPPFANLVYFVKLLQTGRRRRRRRPAAGGGPSASSPRCLAIGGAEVWDGGLPIFDDAGGVAAPAPAGNEEAALALLREKQVMLTMSRQSLALMRSVANLSVEEWLRVVDERGGLLQYHAALARNYDSAEQIVSVYARAAPDGSATIEPEFFKDMGVHMLGHRRLFQQWFEN